MPRVCALVGPNNAGKSNILSAIRTVLARDWGPRPADFSEEDVFGCDPDLDIEIAVTFAEALPYARLKDAEPIQIAGFRFTFDRYQRGEQKGQRKLEQRLLNAKGEHIKSIQTTYPSKGQPPKFDPLYTIPQDVREQVPVIYVSADRKLQDQLPSARHSLLRRMFEEIDRKLHEPDETAIRKNADGTETEVHRLTEFREMMAVAIDLLRTKDFERLEQAIKRNALEQLGLNPAMDDVATPTVGFSDRDTAVDHTTPRGPKRTPPSRVGAPGCH